MSRYTTRTTTNGHIQIIDTTLNRAVCTCGDTREAARLMRNLNHTARHLPIHVPAPILKGFVAFFSVNKDTHPDARVAIQSATTAATPTAVVPAPPTAA